MMMPTTDGAADLPHHDHPLALRPRSGPIADVAAVLDAAVARFMAAVSRDDPGQYHRVASAIHDVSAAIARVEGRLEPDDVLVRVEPVRRVLSASPLVWRLQNWPRGYAGDFETIEMMCRGGSVDLLEGAARHAEQFTLNFPPVMQHRNKIRRQAALMSEVLVEPPDGDDARVLSIACGPSRDVRLLAPIAPACRGALWLNDGDADAIAFSASMLAPLPLRCHYVPGNVFRVYKALAAAGPFDLVLAGGLFDYLTDRQASHLIGRVHDLMLKPGGRFFFTNIVTGHAYRACMEYLVNWALIERSRDEVVRLCEAAGVARERVHVQTDDTGLALLVTVERA